jgi:hypothetical protein
MSDPSDRPQRYQFGLNRLLWVVVMLAVMLGALAGLLRPGPTFELAGGMTDDVVRGAMGNISLAEDGGQTLHVIRDPAEIKAFLLVAVFAPLAVVIAIGLLARARKSFRGMRRMW